MRNTKVGIALASLLLLSAVVLAANEKSEKESLLGGKVEFSPPPADEWQKAHVSGAADAAAYMSKDHKSLIALQVLPADAQVSPQMGGAIVRQIRENHKQAGQKIVMDPRIERDPHFDLRIHEKFEQDGKTIEQLHLYRNLGPRVVMVTAQSQADGQDKDKSPLKAGEDVALSAKWVKPAGK